MSNNLIFSGARAIFRVNGQKIAFASGVDVTEEVNYEDADVLDNLETEEHVPTAYKVSFTTQIFRTIKGSTGSTNPRDGNFGSMKEMGIFPKAASDQLNVLTRGVLTCTIFDKLAKKIICTLEECKCASNNFSVTARGIVGQNLSWKAKRARDESELE